jgi:hypothetical protein
MLRITAITCLILSLLCPFVCIAETAEERTDSGRTCDDVCEAMAFGAVIARADAGPISPLDLAPSFEGHYTSGFLTLRLDLLSLSPVGAREPAGWQGDAGRRHALLQTFLF